MRRMNSHGYLCELEGRLRPLRASPVAIAAAALTARSERDLLLRLWEFGDARPLTRPAILTLPFTGCERNHLPGAAR